MSRFWQHLSGDGGAEPAGSPDETPPADDAEVLDAFSRAVVTR